jgi:hypothetical protein
MASHFVYIIYLFAESVPLFAALAVNKSLTILNLEENSIGPLGAQVRELKECYGVLGGEGRE